MKLRVIILSVLLLSLHCCAMDTDNDFQTIIIKNLKQTKESISPVDLSIKHHDGTLSSLMKEQVTFFLEKEKRKKDIRIYVDIVGSIMEYEDVSNENKDQVHQEAVFFLNEEKEVQNALEAYSADLKRRIDIAYEQDESESE